MLDFLLWNIYFIGKISINLWLLCVFDSKLYGFLDAFKSYVHINRFKYIDSSIQITNLLT